MEGWKGALAALGGSWATMHDGASTGMLGGGAGHHGVLYSPKQGDATQNPAGSCPRVQKLLHVLGAMQLQDHDGMGGHAWLLKTHRAPACPCLHVQGQQHSPVSVCVPGSQNNEAVWEGGWL